MVHVAEGVETTRGALHLARQAGVEMPIVDAMYRVLFEGLRPTDAIQELMTRDVGDELAGLPEMFPSG
jgi:glycerol-3-phosphate dehydrogenase (NAD(P)+)